MKSAKTISFIIPVYNVESYLSFCINSILSQDFSDYEIILVDDGSTDSSGTICDEYAQKYPFITVKHKTNGGLSTARNAGLLLAAGKYILFVDSDDYIAPNALCRLAECIVAQNEPDVIFLEAKKVFSDGTSIPLGDGYLAERINGQPKDVVMKHLATLPKYPGSACTKLFKRALVTEQDLFFEDGLISEDIDWTLGLFCAAKTFAYCDADYYCYRQSRAGSITYTSTPKSTKCLLYIIKKWASTDLSKAFQKEINAFLAYEYVMALFSYSKLLPKEQKELRPALKEQTWILNHSQNTKAKLTAICCRLLGIHLTAKLLKIAYKSRA